MSGAKLEVPQGAQDFDYNGTTYSSGSVFTTNNECEALDFYKAFKTTNPDAGTDNGSPNFWENVEKRCTGSPPPSPSTNIDTNPPVESDPDTFGGDTGDNQGAPGRPTGGTVKGEPQTAETNPPPAPNEEPTRPPNGESHPTHGGEKSQTQTNAGDPIDLFNGAFYLQETDLEIPNTILPFSFVRTYRSGDASFGPLGWNWDHNYNLYIRELNDGSITLWRNLHEDIFKFGGASFEPPRGVFEKLERVPGIAQVFEITGEGGTIMHFERPAGWIDGERIPIIWIEGRHGNRLVFSYDVKDKLAEVKDDDDRFIKFSYDQCGLLVSISDQAGRKYEYVHDEQTSQLICVRWPPTSDQPNGTTKIYHYEQPFALPELRHNIIRVEDSQGNVFIENKYEQDPASINFAKVIEQLYGGYLYQYRYTQLQWVPANPIHINIPALRVEVMNPDFGLETYTFNYRGDLLDRRYRLSKDKSFRIASWQYEYDAQGNLSIIRKPDGSREIYTYDFSNPDPRMRGKLLRKELTSATIFPAPSRIIFRAKYETTYQLLTEETNEARATTKYKYDFDINPASLSNTGKLLEIVYPDSTNLDGTIQSSVSKFEYNNKGQIKAVIFPNNIRHEIVYGTTTVEKSRRIKQIFDVGGLNIENKLKYDLFGYNNELIDGNGNSTKKIFNALGLVEKIIVSPINGISAEFRIHYNTDKKIVSTERPKGEFVDPVINSVHIIDKFELDVLGYSTKYFLSSNTAEERILKSCPDFRGFPIEITNPDGSKIKKKYDERGLLIFEEFIGTDNKKLNAKKVYDISGKLIQETDTFGLTTKYGYDGFSRISKITLLNDTQILYKWLKGDLLESEEIIGDDGYGNTRQLSKKNYTYDEKGRRTTEIVKYFEDNPAIVVDVITSYIYDNLDRIEKIIDNRGGIKSFKYDTLGRQIVETDPLGNEEHHIYDNVGNLIKTNSYHKEPNGSVSVITKEYTYDARNRRTEIIEPNGSKFIEEYDDRDLVVRQTDNLRITKEFQYNSFNNLIREIHDVGGLAISQRWILDNMSRITDYVDPNGQTSKYHSDSLGRIYKIEYPNGFASTKIFNDVGQIVKEELDSGVEFEYDYNKSNQLVTIKNTIAPIPIIKIASHEFVYDGLDRIVSAKIGTNKVERRYDSLSRLLSEKTHGDTIKCNYDDGSGVVKKNWPDGRTEKYSHDLNGILTKIEQIASSALGEVTNFISSFKPSGPNYFGEASYQINLKIVNKYDERKRVVELSIDSSTGTAEKIKYRYDTANRKQVEAIQGQNPKISYFEFDNKHRLTIAKDGFSSVIPDAFTQNEHDIAINTIKTSAAGASHEEKFSYDLSDARTKYMETGNPDKNYTYFPGYKIQNDGTSNYAYHTDGILQSDGHFTYTVDALGRIIDIKSGANVLCNLEYDAFGRPSVIKENGKPAKSLNYFGSFVEQENENGIASRQITLHPVTGIPIAYHSNRRHYTIFDSHYNLIGLTDSNGVLLETYRYDSFGVPQIYDSVGTALPSSSHGVEPVFGGQRYLSSTGLYLSKRRLMNPVNGVFLSPDPRGYEDSSSLYVYAAQNPVNNIDPNGEIIPFIIAAVVIGGALLGAGYSWYDAYVNPEKYEGAAGYWKPLANTFGGAAIGGVAVLAGEAILAAGGAGIFATATGTTTLTGAQTFTLYGTATAVGGGIGRFGFNNMFPEHIDPVSAETIATDFVIGGALPVVGSALTELGAPVINGARQMFGRAVSGNWRAFGNTWRLLSRSRVQYNRRNLFLNPKNFKNVSSQYWRLSGGAHGSHLHHIWFQNQSRWIPQALRNAGFNLLEIPGSLNTWMGGRLARELGFRGVVTGILTTTGLGSYMATSEMRDWLDVDDFYRVYRTSTTEEVKHPNEIDTTKK